jgi:hypothetical protein
MLIYRAKKGSPLTTEEVDGNFRALDIRIEKLETVTPEAEGLASIQVEQGELRFQGSRGTFFGSVSLPKLFWKPRGAWMANTPYLPLDVVSLEDSLFVCKAPHTSSMLFSQAAWTLLVSFSLDKEQKGNSPTSTPRLPQEAPPTPCFAKPLEKMDLPKDPPVGMIVLLLDAPEQPDLFFWDGSTWRRVKDGQDLTKV